MDNHILPECYVDDLFLKILIPPLNRYNHQQGCFNVAKVMTGRSLNDKFALGIIDNDKKKADYLHEFTEIYSHSESLKLLRHQDLNKHHYFIVISPAIEIWILKICKEGNINLLQYNLPDDLTGLKEITKSKTIDTDKRFRALFLEIKNHNDKAVLKFSGWVRLLKEKNYHLDINELKNV